MNKRTRQGTTQATPLSPEEQEMDIFTPTSLMIGAAHSRSSDTLDHLALPGALVDGALR